MNTLDLGLIGNGTMASLINPLGEVVWMCTPRVDGDPTFCTLLNDAQNEEDFGFFTVELLNLERAEQEYLTNTPVLLTRLYDFDGACVEIRDFHPRFQQFGRMFCPMTLVRQIRRVSGVPRIRVRVRPSAENGSMRRGVTFGSHHIRYVDSQTVLRLTTDASIASIMEELPFVLDDSVTLILGPDETIQDGAAEVGRKFCEQTVQYWRDWVRSLAIPFEWQDDVIRAAITLQLNAVEDTGAIIAAVTTSIPEAPDSGRNWDYRFCWLRDGFMVVGALNRLGATRTMERYLHFIVNIAAGSDNGQLQPVYAINGRAALVERQIPTLRGYRDMGPVRIGNQAYEQIQHDVYGSAILSATHIFFDRRLVRGDDEALFRRLEPLGERAILMYDQPDAGIWEFRGRLEPHTFSAVMCWAACDRLARIASLLQFEDRAVYWREHADTIRADIIKRSWSADRNTFTATLTGERIDASLLLLHEVGFLAADDPRFVGTVEAIERELLKGDFVFRYFEEDDFGAPTNAFLVCTFWYVSALAVIGRRAEARVVFERLLALRNRHGLLAEHVNPATGEQWGNFVQTYSMVGLITCAIRLSQSWDQAF
ncbi:MAG: glycoside hydrolase family 15 protein [Phycisphaerae bacterium]|nr:glycoside hydrolase family 15 protein [Gemmatimonadaceae bacterium]